MRNLLLSYFYFVNETYDYFPQTVELAARAAKLFRQDRANDEYINNITHPAAFETNGGSDEASGMYVVNNTKLSEAYDTLCQDLGCAMMVFNLVDKNKGDLNEYNLDLPYVACNSSFYQPSIFKELIETTDKAFKLQNNYYECRNDPFDIASFVIGISTGNAQVATVAVMFVFFFILGQYLRYSIGYKTGYGDLEIETNNIEIKSNQNKDDYIVDSFSSQSEIELSSKVKQLEKSFLKMQNENLRQQRVMSFICENVQGNTSYLSFYYTNTY
jgi:hypothetical protein